MPHTNAGRTERRRGLTRFAATVSTLSLLSTTPLAAQARIGNHTRLERFGIDLGYGVLVGLAFAAYDQARNDPPEWGKGGAGYARRAASNVGGFVIEDGVTEGLAAAMNRPLDYAHCKCQGVGPRTRHALLGSITDELPNGGRALRCLASSAPTPAPSRSPRGGQAAAVTGYRSGLDGAPLRSRSAPASISFMNS